MVSARKALFVTAGLICFAAGTVGIFLPILPTVPLYLLAGVCLANGSERLSAWFESTRFYARHVASIKAGEGMTMRSKITSFLAICLLLGLGFYMMRRTPAKWILMGVVVFHAWLFFVHLPTREG
jgi:uncharacterized membrane protein YbaN (DUF454 family)